MVGKKKSRIEYVGLKEVFGGTILKTVKIHKPVVINKGEETIFRVHFKAELLELEKLLAYEQEDIFIYHVYVQWEIYCQRVGEDGSVATYKEEVIDSYLVPSCPKMKEAEVLKGSVGVTKGYIEEYEEEEYITLEVALILGGSSL